MWDGYFGGSKLPNSLNHVRFEILGNEWTEIDKETRIIIERKFIGTVHREKIQNSK